MKGNIKAMPHEKSNYLLMNPILLGSLLQRQIIPSRTNSYPHNVHIGRTGIGPVTGVPLFYFQVDSTCHKCAKIQGT